MKPLMFAVATAVCWSVGGFFEKRGLFIGGLSPLMGITVRTAIALIVLGAASYPQWSALQGAGLKAILYLVIGGGIIAGSLGMLSFYTALGSGQLGRVMPVAFGLTPLLGFVLGAVFLKEPVTAAKVTGVLMVSAGVFLIAGK